MNTALWIVQGLLAAAFLATGIFKSLRYEKAWNSMPWVKDTRKAVAIAAGWAEILGGIGLVVPWATDIAPILTPIAACALGVVMLLAALLHLRRREYPMIGANIFLTALTVFLAIGRF